MNQIRVNGKTYKVEGNCIRISNDQVFVDGKKVDFDDQDIKRIVIEGNVGHLEVKGGDVEVKGNVEGDINADGSVNCYNISKNVNCGGSVNCDEVRGDVKCGGSVNCDDVGGNVSCGGNVIRS